MNNSLKLTPGQFAKSIGRSPQWVSMYVKRGKLKKDEDGYINLEEPQNKLWLQSWTAKGNTFDIVPTNGSKSEANQTTEHRLEAQPVSNYSLDAEKKQSEINHIRARTRNEEIKYRKHSQNLISKEEAEAVFKYAANVFYDSYRRNIGRILSCITDKIEVSEDSYLDTKSTVESALKEIHSETRKELLDGLKNLADQYSEVRQRGEHK